MKTVINVSNIKGNGCATTIEKALLKFIGVERVAVNLREGEIEILHTDEVSREKITEKLLSLGYPERLKEL